MKNTLKKWTSILLLGVVAVSGTTMIQATPAYATSSVDKIVDSNSKSIGERPAGQSTTKTDKDGNTYYYAGGEIESVQAKDVNKWTKKKGNDVISVFTYFGRYLAIGIFIIAAFMMAGGALTKSDWFKRGVFAMAIAIVMWAAVAFAPDLVDFFTGWLAS